MISFFLVSLPNNKKNKYMTNKSLKADLKEILSNTSNIRVSAGGVSMHSIEVEFIEQASFSSYIYYERVNERDEDLLELEILLEK